MDPYRGQADETDAAEEDARARLGSLRLVEPKERRVLKHQAAVNGALLGFAVVVAMATATSAKAVGLTILVCGFLISGPFLFSLWQFWTTKIELYDNGIIVRRGRHCDTMVFDDVDEVWMDLNRRGNVAFISALRLKEHSGAEHRVPFPLMAAVEVIRTVHHRCSLSLIADAREALSTGDELTFGEVTISSEAIVIGGVGTRWDDLRLVRFCSGSIELFHHGARREWAKVRLDEVPHPALFIALVRQLAPATEDDKMEGIILLD